MIALQLRCESSISKHMTLWIQQQGHGSRQIPVTGCTDIDDFTKKIRKKLKTKCFVTVHSSLEKEPFRPGLQIKDLLQTDAVRNNSADNPLFVKVILKTKNARIPGRSTSETLITSMSHSQTFSDTP